MAAIEDTARAHDSEAGNSREWMTPRRFVVLVNAT
jgi:hypothetical protein